MATSRPSRKKLGKKIPDAKLATKRKAKKKRVTADPNLPTRKRARQKGITAPKRRG
jgi:hypothetical protein